MPYGSDPIVAGSGSGYGKDPVQGGQQTQPTAAFPAIRTGAENLLQGVNTGLAGDVVGAGQLAGSVLPSWLTDPITGSAPAQRLSQQAQRPTTGLAGGAGNLVGAVAPFLAQPQLGIGTAARAVPYVGRGLEWLWNVARTGTLPAVLQPTSSQTAAKPGEFWKEKAEQAGIGTAIGTVASLPGVAARALGYRDVPQLLRAMESHSPQFVQKTFDAFRQLSIPGFNKAWYRHVLEPLGLREPQQVGHAGLNELDNMIGQELDNATVGMTLDARAGSSARTALEQARSDATDRLLTNGNAATSFNRLVNRDFNRPLTAALNRFDSGELQTATSNLKTAADRIVPDSAENRALKRELENFRHEIFAQANGGDPGRYRAAREAWRRFAIGREATPPTQQMFTPAGILTRMDQRNPFQVPLGRATGQDVAQAGHEALLMPGRAAQRAQAGLPPRQPSFQPLSTSLSAAASSAISDAHRRRPGTEARHSGPVPGTESREEQERP